MKKYKNRVLDTVLADALQAKSAVLIEGAKWCGKTTTAEQISKSIIHHTGTGRFSWIKMRPMALFESEESSGSVSFAELFAGKVRLGDAMPLMRIV